MKHEEWKDNDNCSGLSPIVYTISWGTIGNF